MRNVSVIPFSMKPAGCRREAFDGVSSDPTAAVSADLIGTRRRRIGSRDALRLVSVGSGSRHTGRSEIHSGLTCRLIAHIVGDQSIPLRTIFWIPASDGISATDEGITSRRTECPLGPATAKPTTVQPPVIGGL